MNVDRSGRRGSLRWGAHPDDLEICCAGTLAQCAARGDEVTMTHVGNGDAGSHGKPPEEIDLH